MATNQEQIELIEKEIRETPYHKGTERHIGILRAKIARLKEKDFEAGIKKGGGGAGGYAVKKQGDATVVLIGPPSVGKSTLINTLTNANSKVAPYAFTTVSVIPGMMNYQDAYVQILDVPGLIEGAAEGKGRGREVLSVARGADLLVIMSDIKHLHLLEVITNSLERNGIRINRDKPKVRIEKRLNGGVMIHTNIHQNLGKETIKDVVTEMGIKNGDIYIEENITMERLLDALSKNRVYVPAIYVINKIDESSPQEVYAKIPYKDATLISAAHHMGLEQLKADIWNALGLIRVYLVRANEEPHMDAPMVIAKGTTLGEVATGIGTEFAEMKRKAKIWGKGSKFPGQEVSLAIEVQDGMMVRFI